MNDELSPDAKRKWFLWGMTLAWIPFIAVIIGPLNAFKGIPDTKATGLGAVAGGLAEGCATMGKIATLLMPVAAIALLGMSLSSLRPMRTLVAWLSICWSVLVLALSGLSVWLFIQMSQIANVTH